MNVNLSRFLDREHLESIRAIRPDDLAPSLGTIIRAIVMKSSATSSTIDVRWPYYRPEVFFENTELTDSFAEIIRGVITSLMHESVAGIFLNLDMGSGKTHLLALLLHLFASCQLNPVLCSEYLNEYRRRTGYTERIANKTVVIATDMRTPESLFDHLKLTEIILRNMGAYEAAKIIRDSIEHRKLPNPKELAEKIPDDAHMLILVDELHYAVTMGSEREWELVKQFISFIMELVNYRREIPTRRGGIVLLVASARRDFERWHEIEADIATRDSELVAKVNGFIEQLQRVEKVITTRWLSLNEAQKILKKRLRLKTSFNNVFHESFNRLIERIIKADSDIPQAHHMRSLIKAMAIYALNALDSGDDIVSPAHFSEAVIDTLLGGADIARSYKSIYSEIMSRLVNVEHKRWFELAINTIFTYTITGSPEKLIEMVRAAKTRETPAEYIPLIKEAELRDILVNVHGLRESEVIDIIKSLDDIHPNIHRVRLAKGEEAFFIAPVASVLAIYKKMIREKYERYMGETQKVLSYISEYIESLRRSEELVEQVVVRSLKELEKKPHSRDKFYIYVYFNDVLISQLTPRGETSQESFEEMLKEARNFYERRPEHNIVIVIPKVKDRVLNGIAKYLAIDEATEFVINRYIAGLEKGILFAGGKADEILRELLRIELKDLEAEIGRRLNEAISSLVNAMISLLDTAIYYTPEGLRIVSIKLDVSDIEGFARLPEIRKVIDSLRSKKQRAIINVAEKLSKWIISRGPIRLIESTSDAGHILSSSIRDWLQSRLYAIIYLTDPRIERLREGTWVYIPSKTVKAARGWVIEQVEREFGTKYEVIKTEDAKRVVIELKPKKPPSLLGQQVPQRTERSTSVAIQQPSRDLIDVINDIAKGRGGVLWIAIEITKDSVELVKEALSMITKYIKDYKEEHRHEG